MKQFLVVGTQWMDVQRQWMNSHLRKRSHDLGFILRHWNEGGASSHHESLDARPVLSALLSEINAEQIKHLWVYDQSRLSRNDYVASAIRYACQKHGVYDLSNPSDMLLKQIMDAMAEGASKSCIDSCAIG